VEQVIRKNEHEGKKPAGGYLLPDDEDDEPIDRDEDEADNE